MTWAKFGGFSACAIGMEQVAFGSAPITRMAALICTVLSGFLVVWLIAYQCGRESAFADMRKFSRAFTRAKEP